MDRIVNDAPTIILLLVVLVAAGKLFTKPLPSNDLGIHIHTNRLKGEIYEVRHSDRLMFDDTYQVP
jgi:hypothetical protein